MNVHDIPRSLMPRLPRAKPAMLLAGGVSLVIALLLAAVTAAVGFGGLAGLGGLVGANGLDYARGPLGEFFPLTDAFVEDALGPGFRRTPVSPAVPIGSDTGSASTPAIERVGRGDTPDAVPPRDETRTDLGSNDFASAYAVRGLPFTTRNSESSDRQPGEPSSCTSSGGTTWFRYTPRTDADLRATTTGSDLSAAVGVFTGTSLATLRQVACASDAAGNAATSFTAKRGTTYWFQVTKTLGSGAVVFSLDLRGTTDLVREVDGVGDRAAVSGNGRYVLYSAEGALANVAGNPCVNLRSSNTRACQQLYVRDLRTGLTELISSPDGGETDGDENSRVGAITPDGRFVAFYSLATKLVPEDNNGMWDAFVRDRATGRTTRVSLTSEGEETRSEGQPTTIALSADGRYVAFESQAPELVVRPADQRINNTSCCRQVFVHDTATAQTRLVSTDEEGNPDTEATVAGLSADGHRVAFVAQGQVYVSDWKRRQVETVSVAHTGLDVDGGCPSGQCLSGDGRYAVFQSAEPAVADDTNGEIDIFVRDLVSDRTTRVSVDSSGGQSNPSAGSGSTLNAGGSNFVAISVAAAISPDGGHVAFSSNAPDLVAGDTNNRYDVFVHDLRRRTTSRVSVLDDGSQSESGTSYQPSVSDKARTVVFLSEAFTTQEGPTTYGHYARQRPEL